MSIAWGPEPVKDARTMANELLGSNLHRPPTCRVLHTVTREQAAHGGVHELRQFIREAIADRQDTTRDERRAAMEIQIALSNMGRLGIPVTFGTCLGLVEIVRACLGVEDTEVEK